MDLADSDDEAPEETVERKRNTESWNIIKDRMPDFSNQMVALGGNRSLRKQVCSEVHHGIRGARSDDTSALKRALPDYITLTAADAAVMVSPAMAVAPATPATPTPSPATSASGTPAAPTAPQPKIKTQGNKVDRGWANEDTAGLNCPVRLAATQDTFARIRSGEINVLGTELPYFMYRYGYIYNAADMEDGLLEGPTLYAVAKHIYQGPSAALKAPGFNRGKAGNAALNGVTSLNGRDIAYIACQLRFSLSSQTSWGTMDGAFSYPEFFWSIVDLLCGDEGQAILDRFNYAVFGTTVSAVKKNAAAATNTASDFEVLEAQRAAKRARKVAAAAAAAAIPAEA
ncbi:hypothetical protein DFH08DRAFT_759473 [Mycena albidolilacea]|uniref:Uncharacterized protein n=1 Tax=Mycena albidolilacea TaxID=1033008 RepID=A0AAD7E873_9AGAR|nr:hypothetical protein DFH08DRAFT_759473 [Mycena albidolilacea]